MYIFKWVLLICMFGTSSIIGILISKKYSNRLQILKDIKSGLNIFEVKIKFSMETIPEIFNDISKKIKGIAGKIFSDSVENMNNMTAGDAWEKAIENNSENLKMDDINSLKQLGKLLGKTDIDGQLSQIKLVSEFLEEQIMQAVDEKNKNEKMYKKLGVVVGLIMVIVLV